MIPRILVVDDDAELLDTLKRILEMAGYEVLTAGGGHQASRILNSMVIHLVVTDIIMEDKDGLSLIREIRALHPDTRIVAISGGGLNPADSYLPAALSLGANATFTKPLPIPLFLETVKKWVGSGSPLAPPLAH